MKMNKKGFTLVELLAVIVILAVVMLIGVTAVGPLMARSRKSALATEGLGIVDAAKAAIQAEQLSASSSINSTSDVCFDLKWLCTNGYYEKGCNDDYTGSVLADYNNGSYSYKFWISNGVYVFANQDPTSYDINSATDGDTAATNCGGATVTTYCAGTAQGC